MSERAEMAKQFGNEAAKLNWEDAKSLQLAVTAFAYAYVSDTHVRACGLARENYVKISAQLMDADAKNTFEGADAGQGLELMLRLGGLDEKSCLPNHLMPTQKGDAAIMYVIGSAMKK